VDYLEQELEETKDTFREFKADNLEYDEEEDEEFGERRSQSGASMSEQGANGGRIVGYLTKEEKKALAMEMFKGNDKIFENHMKVIKEMFT